jgi:hypothetical protein
MTSTPENAPPRARNAPWQKGQSGNPAGKPKGTRHKATLAMEVLLDGEVESLTRKAVEMALAGDTTALRLCLDRIAPARRDRPITFDLPAIKTAADAAQAASAILAAVSAGHVTPGEAAELGKLVEAFARTLEVAEREDRISRLENRTNQ